MPTSELLERYSRQLILDEVGSSGQQRLSQARILVIGLGGLGAPAALYLAAAGIGMLGLADPDTVQLSNLNRQILYTSADLHRNKAEVAATHLRKLNPALQISTHIVKVDTAILQHLLPLYDLVLEATDSFATKFLINDACVAAAKPFLHAGVRAWEGQILFYQPGKACYRCLFHAPPAEVPDCSQTGIMGVTAGLLGVMQATEAIKYFLKQSCLQNQLLTCNLKTGCFRLIGLQPNPTCLCGRSEY